MPSQPNAVKRWMNRTGVDEFLLGIALAVCLGYWWPEPGVATGPLSIGELTDYGVALIFFFYGLRLSPQKMRAGLSNWKVHVVIQLTTFVLFPLLILSFRPVFAGTDAAILWAGCFFLATLPSTVSSSVVMVSVAHGNIPSAIFNASVSSLIGIFITPLWTGLFLTAETGEFDSSDVVLKLILQVLLPVCAGLILHRWLRSFAEKYKSWLRRFDQLVILLIIYASFSHSFTDHIFEGLSALELMGLSVAVLLLFAIVFAITSRISKWLGFSEADRITVIFCGSKKSLVHGSVMADVLFGNSPAAGIIILPVMLYHAFQLIIVSVIARRWGRKNETTQPVA